MSQWMICHECQCSRMSTCRWSALSFKRSYKQTHHLDCEQQHAANAELAALLPHHLRQGWSQKVQSKIFKPLWPSPNMRSRKSFVGCNQYQRACHFISQRGMSYGSFRIFAFVDNAYEPYFRQVQGHEGQWQRTICTTYDPLTLRGHRLCKRVPEPVPVGHVKSPYLFPSCHSVFPFLISNTASVLGLIVIMRNSFTTKNPMDPIFPCHRSFTWIIEAKCEHRCMDLSMEHGWDQVVPLHLTLTTSSYRHWYTYIQSEPLTTQT